MSKKLILVMVFALVFAFTCAAYAEVQNVKVGGDITSVGLSRESLDFQHGGNSETSANNEFATISRIKIEADLTDSVSVTFKLLNERVWGGAVGTDTRVSNGQVDISQAFVTLKEFMKPTIGVPLNLVIGKQPIKIGSGLMVGALNTNQSNTTQLPAGAGDFSVRSSFDAIVGVWDWTPEFTMTTGYVKASNVTVTAGDDSDVYVVDAAYKLGEDVMSTTLEGTYVMARTVRNNVNNFGARVLMSPIKDLNLEGEFVYQLANQHGTGAQYAAAGYFSDNHRNKAATATRLAGSYAFPEVVWKPMFGLDFMRLTNTWNKLHESLVPADLANLIFDNTNLRVYGATAAVTPMDDLMLKVRIVNLSLDKKYAAAANYNSTAMGAYAMSSDSRNLGNEVDVSLAYDYTSDVQFGLGYGILKPGKAFTTANRKTATQVLGSMKVSF